MSGFLICVVFIFVYGEHYDWLNGSEIPTAIIFATVLLVTALYKARHEENPYISIATFKQPNMLFLFILFGCMTLMSATSSSLQNTFTNAILGYDVRHNIDLNWGAFFGVIFGAGYCYMCIVKWKWRIKSVVFSGFLFFFMYQLMLYFLIDASIDQNMLYLPMFFKGAGLCICYTILTYALAVGVPFKYYFEAMCVIGFIRTSFGNPMSSAIITRAFNYIKAKNLGLLSGEIDVTHPLSDSFTTVYGEVQRQMLMVSIKEVYGYAIIIALIILAIILLSDYRRYIIPPTNNMAKLSHIWKTIRHNAG